MRRRRWPTIWLVTGGLALLVLGWTLMPRREEGRAHRPEPPAKGKRLLARVSGG